MRKRDTLPKCWFNAGPVLIQHWINLFVGVSASDVIQYDVIAPADFLCFPQNCPFVRSLIDVYGMVGRNRSP